MIQEAAIWFNENDFATPATLTPDGGSAVSTTVIFHNENSPYNIGDVEVINDKPTAEILTEVIGSSKSGTLVIGSITWYYIDATPDMDGIKILTLSRVSKR